MMTTMEYHNPVLLNETVHGLNIKHDGVYVDVTFGGGGHSKEILKRLGPNGRLFGFDQDEDLDFFLGQPNWHVFGHHRICQCGNATCQN